MTPAINALKKAKLPFTIHQYKHEPNNQNFGLEAVEKLGLNAEQVFKTLVVKTDKKLLAVAIVPVSCQLNVKLMAKALKTKKLDMAPANEVERSTGYVLGGVSPIGQKKRLVTVIDASAKTLDSIYVSAGRRGLELELLPDDLAAITSGTYAPLAG